MHLYQKKPFYKSTGIIGSVGSIAAIIGLIRQLLELYNSIPPELIDETKIWFYSVAALLSSGVALIGRWRAKFKIDNPFKRK